MDGVYPLTGDVVADRAGHVTVMVEIRNESDATWVMTVRLLLEAGQREQLSRAALAFETTLLLNSRDDG
ncbi:MAG: hypothetical protein ABIT38_05590 [Gemmatimonadaceae bacterium]